MKLDQSFTVGAPVEEVWAALIDVERVAPCLPGAQITGHDEEGVYRGEFTVKLGPTTAAYRGSLRVEDADESARRVTMNARGSDKRGQGNASATIVSSMTEVEGGGTQVDVSTDFHLTGRLASFGRSGMIEDVSNRLMREFAACLQDALGGAGAAAPAASPAPDASASPAGASTSDARGSASPGAPPASPADASPGAPPASPADASPRPPVLQGDVPAEAAGGAAPPADPAGAGTLGVPPPSDPGRQPPGATGGAAGPEGVTEAPEPEADAADAAVASAGGAAVEAASAGAAPPDAEELAAGPAAPAPPPDAGVTPPPPPGGPGGEVPTAGGAGGAPPPPRTGPPPPPGGRERHAEPEPEPAPRTGSIPPPGKPEEPPAPARSPGGGLVERIRRLLKRG
jgi:uncharacterized protein